MLSASKTEELLEPKRRPAAVQDCTDRNPRLPYRLRRCPIVQALVARRHDQFVRHWHSLAALVARGRLQSKSAIATTATAGSPRTGEPRRNCQRLCPLT